MNSSKWSPKLTLVFLAMAHLLKYQILVHLGGHVNRRPTNPQETSRQRRTGVVLLFPADRSFRTEALARLSATLPATRLAIAPAVSNAAPLPDIAPPTSSKNAGTTRQPHPHRAAAGRRHGPPHHPQLESAGSPDVHH